MTEQQFSRTTTARQFILAKVRFELAMIAGNMGLLAAIVLPSNPQIHPIMNAASLVLFLLAICMGTLAFWGQLWLWKNPPVDKGCAHCGYDLTGNVSGVCPECGERI